MSLAAKRRDRPIPVMNVTPLVDVVLVLLIIFMVVIPMMEKNPQVILPDIFNPDAENKGKADPFTLAVTAAGELHFEQDYVPENRLEAVLREANQREPARRLVLRADKASVYSDVRKLFKICQGVGFPGMSLQVNAVTPQKP